MPKIGKHRCVLAIGPLAVKFPLVRVCHYLAVGWRFHFDFAGRGWGLFKELILGGLIENAREALCYLRTRHQLLAPLYLPLIFVNVYQRKRGVNKFILDGDKFLCDFLDCAEGSERQNRMDVIAHCSHTFDHPENFSYDEGRVFVLDYGEEGFENLLAHYAAEIEKHLMSQASKNEG